MRKTRRISVPRPGDLRLEPRDVTILDGHRLTPGDRIQGPAVIEYADTTVFVPEPMSATIDPWQSCVLR